VTGFLVVIIAAAGSAAPRDRGGPARPGAG